METWNSLLYRTISCTITTILELTLLDTKGRTRILRWTVLVMVQWLEMWFTTSTRMAILPMVPNAAPVAFMWMVARGLWLSVTSFIIPIWAWNLPASIQAGTPVSLRFVTTSSITIPKPALPWAGMIQSAAVLKTA